MTQKNTTRIRDEVVRDETYVTAIPTEITLEEASPENPFHTENMYIHGYEHLELAASLSFTEMLFLMFKGEVPDEQQARLLEKLFNCLINPGPRHPATRAAMNAGVARTKLHQVLPVGLAIASGTYLGSADVFNSMHFLRSNIEKDPEQVALQALNSGDFHIEKHPHVAPGFGSFYGGADCYTQKLVDFISEYNTNGQFFDFAKALVKAWQQKNDAIGWLVSGFAAANLCDLGFHPRQGNVVFQMAVSPGLAAHAVEKANKPVTDMPFVPEKNYFIDEGALAKRENTSEESDK